MAHRLQGILAQLAPIQMPHSDLVPIRPQQIGSRCTAAAAASTPAVATADLCDSHPDEIALLPFQWRNFGQATSFHGSAVTLKTFEDNGLVRTTLEKQGQGRVLLIDGGGSLRCALVGDQIAALAAKNGWAGVVVHGAVRDATTIDAECSVSIKALGTSPVKSIRRGWGAIDVPITFGQQGGIVIRTGDYVYADADGVLVAKKPLHLMIKK